MSIVCDTCGKVANAKGCPPDMHWFQWIMDQRRGKDAMVTMPNEEGEIGTICYECLEKTLAEKKQTDNEPTPKTK